MANAAGANDGLRSDEVSVVLAACMTRRVRRALVWYEAGALRLVSVSTMNAVLMAEKRPAYAGHGEN